MFKLKILLIFTLSCFLFTAGCGLFKNRREQEIKERLERLREEMDKKSDSVRRQQIKFLNDSANEEIMRSLDSLKHSSDSLEKVIEQNIKELKRKNQTK